MATPSICAVDGCDKPARTRGWCNTHHLRFLRHGDPAAGRALNGEHLRYMLEHMWDDCPKWPFPRPANGYGLINYQGKRSSRVHRVVCEIANGPPPTPDHEAAHNCGKGHEGCFGARCLEWKTRVENMRDAQLHGTWVHGETHPLAKLTDDEAREIKRMKPEGRKWGFAVRVAERYGVSDTVVRDIWSGRAWAWLKVEGASA